MSTSSYDSGYDTFPQVADGDIVSAALENKQSDAISAIEATLGLDPGGGVTVGEALAGKLGTRGGIMAGDIAMTGHKMTGLADPAAGQDAATKYYVDTRVGDANPMTTAGDMVIGGPAGAETRLAGDTSDARRFLREQSVSGVAQAPAWDSLQAGDIPTLSSSRISDFDSQVRTSRLDQMASPVSDVSLAGHRLTGVAEPSSAQDAATKHYVDTNAPSSSAFGAHLHAGSSGDAPRLPISSVINLQSGLDSKAPLGSPALTGAPTAPTASSGTGGTQIATCGYADASSQSLAGLGTYSNLRVVNDGSQPNSRLNITADFLMVSSASACLAMRSLSVSPVITASGADGLDTGSVAASTCYFVWVIAKADGTVAGLFSTSSTAPTLPSGYGFKRLVGAVITSSSSNLPRFRQSNETVLYQTYNIILGTGSAGSATQITTSAAVPSIASEMLVQFEVYGVNMGATTAVILSGTTSGNGFAFQRVNSAAGAATWGSSQFTVPNAALYYYVTNSGQASVYVQGFRLGL